MTTTLIITILVKFLIGLFFQLAGRLSLEDMPCIAIACFLISGTFSPFFWPWNFQAYFSYLCKQDKKR